MSPTDKRTTRAKAKANNICGRCLIAPAIIGRCCESCAKKQYESKQRSDKKLRLEVYTAYGNKCACPPCGESITKFLTLDHVNNDGYKHRKELHDNSRAIYVWAKENSYPPTLQILCSNCNLGKMRNLGICPHMEQIL